jgi:hypothetical protein
MTDTTDALVERVRQLSETLHHWGAIDGGNDLAKAADTIAALKAENESLTKGDPFDHFRAVIAACGRRNEQKDARIAALQAGVKEAADQFAFYADQHRAKGTDDGNAKAATNQQWADRLRALGASR